MKENHISYYEAVQPVLLFQIYFDLNVVICLKNTILAFRLTTSVSYVVYYLFSVVDLLRSEKYMQETKTYYRIIFSLELHGLTQNQPCYFIS